jgi:hypothetical protein
VRFEHHAAGIPRLGVASIQLAGRLRAIHTETGVVHHARIARLELDGAHVPRRVHGYGDHERAEDVRAVGANGVRFRHADDEIRRAEPPSGDEFRGRRKAGWIALLDSARDPLLDRPALGVGEPSFVLEIAGGRDSSPPQSASRAASRRRR